MGEATGPLLTELHLKNTGDQNCYYAIKATGEFASAGDWGNEETEDASATGFYLNGITENALELLTEVADLSKEPVIEEPTAEEIAMEQIQAIKAGTATTVTIDDTEFYVLAKQEHQALLMQKEAVAADTFSDCSNKWEESEIRTYLNRKESGGWLNGKATLQNLVVPTKIHTITEYDNDTLASTTDQVFLLSEADVFGTSGAVTVTADHYTTGAKLAVPEEGWIAYDSSGKSVSWWLRSPCANGDYLADVHEDAELYAAQYRTEHLYIRPVLWVKF